MANIKKLLKKAGDNLSAKEIKQIQKQTRYTPESIIRRAENAGINVKPAAQNFVQQFATQQTQAQEQRATEAAPAGTQPVFSYSPEGRITSVTYEPTQVTPSDSSSSSSAASASTGTGTEGYEDFLNIQAALRKTELDNQFNIEQLRDAGMTERQRLVNENNLAVTEKEVGGKLDLQKIVNAGYKNIANIERGSNMFASIMSAFNF
jgi:hypothetical protein